jgi:2-oxoisovalerate dehydrogenase E2 component (dihydrolipoyl transacylase)
MGEHVIRLPDVGEGVAEAELVEWQVKVGDLVREDAILGAVMTDKATVEIPSPVEGEVLWLGAEVGDVIPVGSELIRLKVAGEDSRSATGETQNVAAAKAPTVKEARYVRSATPRIGDLKAPARAATALSSFTTDKPAQTTLPRQFVRGARRPEGEKPLAAPAVRLRALEAGVDLRQVLGSGPAGRITHEDLDAYLAHGADIARMAPLQAKTAVTDVKLVGLRRKIAEKMAISSSRIPHITYVEEVDVTGLEELRTTLNKQKCQDQPRLTLLPFLMCAMVRAIAEQPNLNSLFDDEAGVVHMHAGVHIGIAAQTPAGLMVPVVKHVEALDLWGCGVELNRLVEAAKAGTATRDELSGSTITITSLGAMGGLVTTPIINHPEVAIVGVNKMVVRPVWDGSTFVPRRMMNLSSSFDHRVVDGWDAARFVQRIKLLLESPALIFID